MATRKLNEIPVDDKEMEKNIHNTWNVLITVSYGFRDMFENWWLHFSKLKLPMRVILIAEDSATYQLYRQNTNIIVFNGLNVLNTNSAVTYKTKAYKKLVSNRPTYLLSFIKLDLNIIYTDIDTVWFTDPRTYFTGDYDMWAGHDGPIRYCTGFLALKSSSAITEFLDQWKSSLEIPDINQSMFNILIKKSTVKHVGLPRNNFPSGDLYFDGNKHTDVVVVHNNFIEGHDEKVERFKKAELWRTN